MSPSPNTQIKPLSFEVSADAKDVSIGGVSVASLAKSYGTPLYVLDKLTLTTMMRAYKDAFSTYPAPVNVLFAGKANLSMGLCSLIAREGLGLDVVSGGEFYTALRAGFPLERVVFNGNNKTRQELELAIGQGVGKISIDNFYEMALIHDVVQSLGQGKKVQAILRITPGIECHTHDYIKTGHIDSKFGFPLSQLNEALTQLTQQYADTIELVGLHAHIGSQIFEIRPYLDLAEVMLNLFQTIRAEFGLTLTHLNLGGGLGISYQGEDDPPSVDALAEPLIAKLISYAKEIDYPLPTLILEPGRSLVATSGVTLYQVGSIKSITEINKTYVAIDGGMGDNIRPALYGAVYSAMVANKPNEPCTRKVTIAGKYCESGDILIREFMAPESIAPGDLFLVFGTGAYNYAMASNYNRMPKPAMILVDQGKAEVLIKAETFDDLIAQDLQPA